ncbi:MAG: helix-turn-helix domain-containing protein [Actinomycetes bacterium]
MDELQESTAAELTALNTAVHRIGQAGSPLPLIVYEYRPVGLLSEQASRDALVVPAGNLGVEWAPDGLSAAVAVAQGYPYFLQSIGKHVWDDARRSPIDLNDVELGLSEAREEIDNGLYRSRWERATPAQRDLLRALATLGREEPAAVADIAEALGKSRSSGISMARNELIKKGLLYAPERGLLAFTVPGMHDFIERQP